MKTCFLKTPAAITAASIVFMTSAVSAEVMRYETDATHTFVTFEVKHFKTSTVRARFDTVTGVIELDRKMGTGKADISIDLHSVSSGINSFNQHLQGPDFFHTDRYPKAAFTSQDFRFDGDQLKTVAGELTLLGKTLPVILKATSYNCYDQPILKAPVCGGDFETTLKRSLWGMNWGLDKGVPDDVRLLIQIEAVKK